MKPIGGFFELELSGRSETYHPNAAALWCGRACLNLVVQKLQPKLVYVPFYSCDTLLEPLSENKIAYQFYGINEALEIAAPLVLQTGELLIYINYFGLKENYAAQLTEIYGASLIIDNTQAFFSCPPQTIWFNSARKFFGVADGAFLSAPFELENDFLENDQTLFEHLFRRLNGEQEKAFAEYVANEETFDSSLRQISQFSRKILESVDYDFIRRRRRGNFVAYERMFGTANRLKCKLGETDVPFCYPLQLEKALDKQRLYQQNIFVPTLWNEVIQRTVVGFDFEKNLAATLLALPCDQRYDAAECQQVGATVQKIINEY